MSDVYSEKRETQTEDRGKGIESTMLCGDQSKIVSEQWQNNNYQHPWKDLEREDAKRVAYFYALSGFPVT